MVPNQFLSKAGVGKRATLISGWPGTLSGPGVSVLTPDRARWLFAATGLLYLGRGIHYPIALEGALKLKQISSIHAAGDPAGEMKHGPNALIDESLLTLVLATVDPEDGGGSLRFEKTISNIQEVKARGGKVVAIATEGAEEAGKVCDHGV